MSKPRQILWIGALVGIAYLVWRWRQQQLAAITPPAPLPAPPPPRPAPTAAAPADPAGVASAGPRRIVTRVHRGAPPATPVRPGADNSVAAPAAPGEPVAPAAPTLGESPAEPVAALAPSLGEALAGVEGPASTLVEEAPAAEAAPAPTPDEEAPAAEAAPTAGPVNLNTADAETLIALPGIGPALAARIISYRDEHGPFATIDQLIDIQGIGPNNLNDFRHLLYV